VLLLRPAPGLNPSPLIRFDPFSGRKTCSPRRSSAKIHALTPLNHKTIQGWGTHGMRKLGAILSFTIPGTA
jgi:hypothetical protein